MSYLGFPNAAPIDDTLSPLYFLHIPKTAGTTFGAFLQSHFEDREVCPAHLWRDLIRLPAPQISRARLIWGHFYAFLCAYAPHSTRYLVLLRDPVDRALSHYEHILSHEEHYFHRRALELAAFGEFLRDPETRTIATNFQVRSLALDLEPAPIAKKLTSEEIARGDLERRLLTVPFDRPIDEMLEAAKVRLKQMCFVGTTERYRESIELLCRRLRWPAPIDIESLNVTETRLRSHRIRPEDLTYLRQINYADYDLYDYACELLEDGLSQW